jgi:putative NADH-flavin reductase
MRLTVFGATGGTGRQLVGQALEAGHEVTAVVRDPGRLGIQHGQLTVVTADVTEPESLRPVVIGRDAVLSALGAPNNRAAGIASRATRAILRALDEEGVTRFLAVSAAPLGPVPEGESLFYRRVVDPLVRRAFRDVYADLAVMEDAVRATALEWTVVRPPRLTDGPRTDTHQRQIGGNVARSHRISRADLAHAMLGMPEDRATVRQTVGVAG